MRAILRADRGDAVAIPEHFPAEVPAEPGAPAWIGRSAAADLVVAGDASIADRHCLIVCYPDECRVVCADTTPVHVNGMAAFEAVLQEGDVLAIGTTRVNVSLGVDVEAADIAVDEPGTPEINAATALLAGQTAPLYAVVDTASDSSLYFTLIEAGELAAPVPSDAEERDYAYAAPWLIRLPSQSPFLSRLVRQTWGRGCCVFLTSRRPFAEVRAALAALFEARLADDTPVLFRFYDPYVLRRMLPRMRVADAHAWFGPDLRTVQSWIVESGPAGESGTTVGGPDAAAPGGEPSDAPAHATVGDASPPDAMLIHSLRTSIALGTAPRGDDRQAQFAGVRVARVPLRAVLR